MEEKKAREKICPILHGFCQGKECMFWRRVPQMIEEDEGYCEIPIRVDE